MMRLELAEEGDTVHTVEQYEHINVPDPNTGKASLISEIFFDPYSDFEFAKFIQYVKPFNDKDYLAHIIARRIVRKSYRHE